MGGQDTQRGITLPTLSPCVRKFVALMLQPHSLASVLPWAVPSALSQLRATSCCVVCRVKLREAPGAASTAVNSANCLSAPCLIAPG